MSERREGAKQGERRKVGITELVSTLGDKRIKLQFIDQCATNLNYSAARNTTRITLLTEDQPLTPHGTRDVGIVLWLPRNEVQRIVFGSEPEQALHARARQAAPELLAALELLVDWTGIRDSRNKGDELLPIEAQPREIQQAMHAIAVARNGAP